MKVVLIATAVEHGHGDVQCRQLLWHNDSNLVRPQGTVRPDGPGCVEPGQRGYVEDGGRAAEQEPRDAVPRVPPRIHGLWLRDVVIERAGHGGAQEHEEGERANETHFCCCQSDLFQKVWRRKRLRLPGRRVHKVTGGGGRDGSLYFSVLECTKMFLFELKSYAKRTNLAYFSRQKLVSTFSRIQIGTNGAVQKEKKCDDAMALVSPSEIARRQVPNS